MPIGRTMPSFFDNDWLGGCLTASSPTTERMASSSTCNRNELILEQSKRTGNGSNETDVMPIMASHHDGRVQTLPRKQQDDFSRTVVLATKNCEKSQFRKVLKVALLKIVGIF